MKIVAFILSIIIFHQSLSVCGPKLGGLKTSDDTETCSMDSKSKVKSCCAKLHQDHKQEKKDKKHKGCCGDDCKCLTCAKIYLHGLMYFSIEEMDISNFGERNIMPLLVHSFDFHPSLTYPPQV